jgi:uncharacterized repeat protein (TIGR03803 family)
MWSAKFNPIYRIHTAVTLAALVVLLLIVARPAQTETETETVVHNFADGSDGANPEAALISDSGGNLYGTTSDGGAFNSGNVFELSPDTGGWTETVLYNCTGGLDGGYPYGPVLLDSLGNLYGTTSGGGAAGSGTVFKLNPSGTTWTESVLYSFSCQQGCNDGRIDEAHESSAR